MVIVTVVEMHLLCSLSREVEFHRTPKM